MNGQFVFPAYLWNLKKGQHFYTVWKYLVIYKRVIKQSECDFWRLYRQHLTVINDFMCAPLDPEFKLHLKSVWYVMVVDWNFVVKWKGVCLFWRYICFWWRQENETWRIFLKEFINCVNSDNSTIQKHKAKSHYAISSYTYCSYQNETPKQFSHFSPRLMYGFHQIGFSN